MLSNRSIAPFPSTFGRWRPSAPAALLVFAFWTVLGTPSHADEPRSPTSAARLQDGDGVTAGNHELARRAKATRSMFFVDIHSVSVYTPAGVRGIDEIRSPTQPVAVRIAVQYDGGMPAPSRRRGGRSLCPCWDPSRSSGFATRLQADVG